MGRVTALVLGTADLGRTGEVHPGYGPGPARAGTGKSRGGDSDGQGAERRRPATDDDLGQRGGVAVSGTDPWRDLLQRTDALQVALRAGPGGTEIGVKDVHDPGSEGQTQQVPSP